MTYLLGLALALLLTGCAIGPVPDTFNNYHDKAPSLSPSTPPTESEPDMATPSRKPAARAPARPTPSAKPPARAPARPAPSAKPPARAPVRPSR